METVVLPDNGFGGPPCRHAPLADSEYHSEINGRTVRQKRRELRREEEKEDEEGMGRIKTEIPWLLLFLTEVR